MNTIGIIGCGHMGSAIAQALLEKGMTVWASNPTPPNFKPSARQKKNFRWTVDNDEVVDNVDIVIIGVRPLNVPEVLQKITPRLAPHHLIVSIAAGVSLKTLKRATGSHKKIVRVMPNLPAQILEGVSVWKAEGLSSQEKKTVHELLESFGISLEVKNEDLINTATAISGGGPAYTAAFLESMANFAKESGFSSDDARVLALATVYGSVAYLAETGIQFGALKHAVQTKGGTTEAGFKVLKKKKWQEALELAFKAGQKRSQELSRGN